MININGDIYKELEKVKDTDSVEYPSMKNLVDKILKEYLQTNGEKKNGK